MGNRMSNIATPMPQIRAKFTSKLGIPLSGCKVYTYEPNSNIPKTTWIDIDKTVENTNPILLDAAGEADIFLDGLYQIVVKDRFGFVVYDVEKTGYEQPIFNDGLLLTWSGRTQEQKNKESISVLDFGAIGSGTLHTVQEWISNGNYKDLAAIQVDYPHVTDLTDSIDWAAAQKAINDAVAKGGGSIFFPKVGTKYAINKALNFPQYSKHVTLYSNGANMDVPRISASDPEYVSVEGFNHVEFVNSTGIGISFGRPKHCTVDVKSVKGSTDFLVMFFATDDLAETCVGNLIRVQDVDGGMTSLGGLGMAAMSFSRIEGFIRNVNPITGIGYGVNFKNKCIGCTADVITTNNKIGFVISNDTGVGNGTGVIGGTFNVTSCGDLTGVSTHRSKFNTVNLTYTGNGLATDRPLSCAAYSLDNTYNITAYNGHVDGYIFSTRSDSQSFNIVKTDVTYGKVGLFEANVDDCNVVLYRQYSRTGSGNSIASLFTFETNCTNILLQNLPDGASIKYDAGDFLESRIVFPSANPVQRFTNTLTMTDTSVIIRYNNKNVLSMSDETAGLFPITDAYTLGRAGYFWTATYSRKQMYTNSIGDFYGSGSPEGVVTAGVGSTYRRTDENANGNLYVKKTGTGNTGWGVA